MCLLTRVCCSDSLSCCCYEMPKGLIMPTRGSGVHLAVDVRMRARVRLWLRCAQPPQPESHIGPIRRTFNKLSRLPRSVEPHNKLSRIAHDIGLIFCWCSANLLYVGASTVVHLVVDVELQHPTWVSTSTVRSTRVSRHSSFCFGCCYPT